MSLRANLTPKNEGSETVMRQTVGGAAASKIARGELFEAVEFLSFLRMTVFARSPSLKPEHVPRARAASRLLHPAFAATNPAEGACIAVLSNQIRQT